MVERERYTTLEGADRRVTHYTCTVNETVDLYKDYFSYRRTCYKHTV